MRSAQKIEWKNGLDPILEQLSQKIIFAIFSRNSEGTRPARDEPGTRTPTYIFVSFFSTEIEKIDRKVIYEKLHIKRI